METVITDLLETQTNPTLAPYAKTGEVHLRVTARAKSEEEADALMKPMMDELFHRFGDKIYTTAGRCSCGTSEREEDDSDNRRVLYGWSARRTDHECCRRIGSV